MPTYIYSRELGCMVDKQTGERMNPPDAPLACPQVVPDISGYQSPIDGRWIEGRRARRYDMESNNCVEGGDLPRLGKLKNEKFAKKRGLEHLLER